MKPNWKRDGMKSNGLYNTPKRSPLSDNPQVSLTKLEMLTAYIERYKADNGRMPSYTHLNREFNMRATKAYYSTLITK